jgi:Tol biopolymer transport system component
MIGKTLAHYEITALLGKGGMGEVYRARDTKLGRDVALKILPPAAATDPERRQRFEREAKAVASLQHPHIVTIHSIDEDEGTHFITMEMVRGKTLSDVTPAEGVPLDQLFEIGISLADAVHAAHDRGVIHRDLKPSNVMVDEAGQLKVLDFGLAKLVTVVDADAQTIAAGDPTQEGRVLGTVAYMSPEQAEGKELDRRSDIFSLGVLLYEAVSGKRPFTGDTPISTMSAILREAPPSVTSLKPLPRHLGRIIHRCLEKKPDKRFQTARDVGNELEGLQREVESGDVESVSGISGSATVPTARPGSRRLKTAWFGLAVAVAVAAAITTYMTVSNRTPASYEDVTPARIRPLTGSVGVTGQGDWSPDGSFFAYAHSTNGPLDIFIRATAGGDPVLLVESPWDDMRPVWSPDNRWIAFLSNREGQMGLYLIPPLGGAIRHLSDLGFDPLTTLASRALGPSAWSPDGGQIVFSRMRDGSCGLWTIDLATGEETSLTSPADADDAHATWSPDGRWIAFRRAAGGKHSLWVVDAGGGEERILRELTSNLLEGHDWSPDGSSIVFPWSREPDGTHLWSIDVDSGKLKRLMSWSMVFFSIGRDGRILANDFRNQSDLYIQRVGGGDPRRLTYHTESNSAARVAPQGDRIAYHSNRTGNNEIWILDQQSGKELQATSHEGSDTDPCWSPDGKTIAFVSTRSGSARLWTVDAGGGAAHPLLDHDDARAPRWSPDGRVIGFLSRSSGVNSLWLIDPEGTRPRSVMDNVEDFAWYKDSGHVIYTSAREQTHIRAVDLETGHDTLLLDEPHVELAAAADGSALTYCSARSHFNMNLRVLRLEQGEDGLPQAAGDPIVLTAGKGQWHVHNGGLTPDGERVVYTRLTATANIYVIEGAFPDFKTAR